jgi:hypothetical protein
MRETGKVGITSKFKTYVGGISRKSQAQGILNVNEFVKY